MSRWMGRFSSFHLNQKYTLSSSVSRHLKAMKVVPQRTNGEVNALTANSSNLGLSAEEQTTHNIPLNKTQPSGRVHTSVSFPCSVLWKLIKVRRERSQVWGWQRLVYKEGGAGDNSSTVTSQAHLGCRKQSRTDDTTDHTGNVATRASTPSWCSKRIRDYGRKSKYQHSKESKGDAINLVGAFKWLHLRKRSDC